MTDSAVADDDGLRDRSTRGASALLVGQGFRFAISMASQIYMARLLFPADFGLVAMISPIIGFVALFSDFGLLQSVVQRRVVSDALLNSIFWINMAICLGLGLFFAALTPLFVWLYSEPRLVPIALLSAVMILVSGFGQLPGALLNRELKFVTIAGIDTTAQATGLLVGITTALNGYGYWAIVLSQVGTSCASTLLTIIFTKWRPSRPASHPEVAAMLRFGGHVTGSKVVLYLNSSIDTLLVGVVLGGTALGIYDRAWRLAAQPLQQLCAPIDRLAVPILSRVQDDTDRYRRAFDQMLPLLCLLAMPGLLYGVVAADRFIPVLLGQQWTSAVVVFQAVCLGAVVSPFNNACFWLFISQGRAAEQLRYTLIVSMINVAAYAVGLIWGLTGVALASALSVYLLQCPILIFASTRSGPVDRAAFLHAAWPAGTAILVSAPLLFALAHAFRQGSLFGIIVGLAAAYAIPAIILACFPAGRTTLQLAWNVLPKRLTAPVTRILASRLKFAR